MEFLKVATFLLFCLAVWIGSPQSDLSKQSDIPSNAEDTTNQQQDIMNYHKKE